MSVLSSVMDVPTPPCTCNNLLKYLCRHKKVGERGTYREGRGGSQSCEGKKHPCVGGVDPVEGVDSVKGFNHVGVV